jgi:hypothetical protein
MGEIAEIVNVVKWDGRRELFQKELLNSLFHRAEQMA